MAGERNSLLFRQVHDFFRGLRITRKFSSAILPLSQVYIRDVFDAVVSFAAKTSELSCASLSQRY